MVETVQSPVQPAPKPAAVGVGLTPPPIPPQAKKGFKKNKLVWIIGAVVLFAIIAAGLVFALSSKNKSSTTEHTSMDMNKVYHVGVLSALDYFYPQVAAFKEGLAELGYVEGKNIVYDVQKMPSPVGNQKIIKKFVDEKVDLIFVFPTEASLEAKDGTKGTNIPIISNSAYVEGNGLIESISHPGGNVTGVRFPIAEVAGKRLELLHEIAPNAKRILVPYLKDYPTVAPSIATIKPIADSLGLTIIEAPFADPAELTAYLKTRATNPGFDAILFVPEPVSIIPPYTDQIYAFADLHKLPIASATVLDTDSGPALALIPSNEEFGSLAAPIADKIFKGINVGDIPIVTPESDLELNYKVIQKLGLTVDEGLMSRAKRIVR